MSLRDVSMFQVLGEDDAHRSFIRGWLSANGVSHRCVHTVEPPADKSGGWSFVLSKCEETVQAARVRNRSKAQTRVVIAIDADEQTVVERVEQVARAIGSTDEHDTSELVCILVPKRHVETWVHALGPTDSPVDENGNYKHKTIEEVRAAARRLARLPSAPLAPPSLVRGYEELQRLRGA